MMRNDECGMMIDECKISQTFIIHQSSIIINSYGFPSPCNTFSSNPLQTLLVRAGARTYNKEYKAKKWKFQNERFT